MPAARTYATNAATCVTYVTTVPSPLGDLRLTGDGTHLTSLLLPAQWAALAVAPSGERGERGAATAGALEWSPDAPPFERAASQLRAYFAGERHLFDLPLAPAGTPFQRRVWQALQEIPYGQTMTYGEVAARIGQPEASRAVGLANGRNRIAIVIPCHRVIGAGGALTGYAAGIERKRWLLALESGRAVPTPLPLD